MCDFNTQIFFVEPTQSIWLGRILLSRLKPSYKAQVLPVASVIRCYEVLKCFTYQRIVYCHASPYELVLRTNRNNN